MTAYGLWTTKLAQIKEPLERLAAEGQLSMYRHTGFWQCMDTLRDAQALNALWDKGNAPWCK